ncbi:5-methylcytosine rRNA methyltransferase NSUN4-like [Nilaparvata lugens]|uniref:5-methylcytosine rRNA methyltransferase NSUN4-like n=1 Tax=Nilaparvata lugens TaxID=108931 RepID=UPI00193E2851|nr:5-methylcytosine rRNA methyltransferase NSUN4-like [Nilaparvata lugens]XP_039275583.1 5-methylcytosine rRNA methyltransferase NSUN4-like [Nilaparvata lugens]XP_039275584.1 5-methylcytosine rRNA methyltransferase NSUN4-like [Nilaparvata lugens]
MFRKCVPRPPLLEVALCTRRQDLIVQFKRWYSAGPNHWATLKNIKRPTDKALEHFDDFYASVFKNSWRSIRVALLSPQKYCAVVNNFADAEETSSMFENIGAFNMRKIIDKEREKLLRRRSTSKRRSSSKVRALDLKLDQLAEQKQMEELRSLYPENSTPGQLISSNEEQNHREDTAIPSLSSSDEEQHPREDSLDWTRQIDGSEEGGASLDSSALYDYMPATRLRGTEEWVSEADHYRYYEHLSAVPTQVVREDQLRFPAHLNVYAYEMGNVTEFQPAGKGRTNVLNYYLMNASSLLPVLALDLNPGDTLLDMCAAPGGKSLLALQTLHPEYVVCNDKFRSKRIQGVIDSYFYDQSRIKVTSRDGAFIDDSNTYNKILVDVPCTNDRHSLMEDDNNIFKPSRIKERFRIPEIQSKLLSNALKIVKVGGTVVYSTCSLSPIQNDGVVQMALRDLWQETKHKIIVKDMTAALEPTSIFFKFDNSYRLKYGHLIVPYLPANFGPLYFCKLVRVE